MDKITPKTEHKDMLDKINNKAQALRDKDKIKNKTKDMDKIIPKTEHKDMLVKMNNKISIINKISTMLAEIKVKLKNKYESMCKLQDDLWLRQVELNKLDAILDDALNVIWNMICEKIERAHNKLKEIMIKLKQNLKKNISLADLLGVNKVTIQMK